MTDSDLEQRQSAGLAPAAAAARFARALTPGALACEEALATRRLRERLDEADVAEIEQLIRDTPGAWQHYAEAQGEGAKRHVLLAFGLWLGAEGLTAKTGLQSYRPPEDVHAMARGPLAAAGGLYEADLIVDALAGAGVEMATIASALDFGSSSGRVLATLAAAYPQTRWQGCDPNAPAIAWAREHLTNIEFFVNADDPPLPLADASLDLIYAISIWSHFAPELGLRWFEEMHRLLRPGAHLLLTTHGLTSVAHYALNDLRTPEQSGEIADALYRAGVWYAPEFGEAGDWGVVNPDWGTAFLTPEWLLTKLSPHWQFLEFAPGRNQDNQDVYVLRRA